MLILREVVKSFTSPDAGPIRAIDGLSLTVQPGEFVTVVGPSGSGKSTLLSVMGGLLAPEFGNVVLGDADLYRLSAGERARLRRTRLGFVFQTFNLVPYLSCVENVALPLLLEGAPRRQAFERADAMLVRLGLSERRKHRPAELSIGERQRAALGRAAIHAPALLLADEPTGNLDPDNAERVVEMLRDINSTGPAVVMVTHDPRYAGAGSRVVTLRDGRIAGDLPAPSKEQAA